MAADKFKNFIHYALWLAYNKKFMLSLNIYRTTKERNFDLNALFQRLAHSLLQSKIGLWSEKFHAQDNSQSSSRESRPRPWRGLQDSISAVSSLLQTMTDGLWRVLISQMAEPVVQPVKSCLYVCLCVNQGGTSQPLNVETCNHAFHSRAGFTLSRALFRKNVGPIIWDCRPYFSVLEKNWRPFSFPFLVITVSDDLSSLACRPLFAIISGVHKVCRSSCGGPFLWGPLFGRTCWTCLNPPLFNRPTDELWSQTKNYVTLT